MNRPAQAYLAAATVRLNTLTAKLERIAEWKEDLAQRLWRAQLLFELVRLDPDEEDRLADVRFMPSQPSALRLPTA